ncbi:MAG: phosphoglucosamine mutase, partial [bacterium]|nr:phosphoglucosamine mutase [bacterium]
MFGTDGIRCPVGTPPLSFEQLPRLGHAIGTWARNKYGSYPTILLAHDTRISSSFIKASLTSGLLLSPVTLYDAQILPTPAVCNIITNNPQFDFGIIISASHNPYQDNGIKLIDAKTGKLDEGDEREISQLFLKEQYYSYDCLGTTYTWPDASKTYLEQVITYFKPNILSGITVVLDCANGATYKVAPELFQTLGAHPIVLHDSPTGTNINADCGSLFPNTLQHAVLKHNATLGFAFDGDGDRVIIVNKDGEIKNGDDILALLTSHPNYQNQKQIVGTIMSNQGLSSFLGEKGKQMIRTQVGDKYISKLLEQEQLLLGGEQSGHIIMRDYLSTGDGIFTALRITETMILTNN